MSGKWIDVRSKDFKNLQNFWNKFTMLHYVTSVSYVIPTHFTPFNFCFLLVCISNFSEPLWLFQQSTVSTGRISDIALSTRLALSTGVSLNGASFIKKAKFLMRFYAAENTTVNPIGRRNDQDCVSIAGSTY